MERYAGKSTGGWDPWSRRYSGIVVLGNAAPLDQLNGPVGSTARSAQFGPTAQLNGSGARTPRFPDAWVSG
ncbi:hypothetical protein GCM10010428_49250 [Actinosynnema pretiosum subsp. pretiosum]